MWDKIAERVYRRDMYELMVETDDRTLAIYRRLSAETPKIQIARSEFKSISEQEALKWAEDILVHSTDLDSLFSDVG